MSDILLSTSSLTKHYGSKAALDKVDIHVHRGDIYGLIGRNGAGKTTLLKILNDQIRPTSGTVNASDQNPGKHHPFGVLIESPGLYPEFNGRENLMLKCIALGIKNPGAEADALLKLVDLKSAGNKKVKNYSLGMKQRLGVALALMGEPELLLLDEPINGMDPQGILEIREMLIHINRTRGVTIVISSHILDELAKFATRYGILENGALIREVTREELENETQNGIEITSRFLDQIKVFFDKKGLTEYQIIGKEKMILREQVEQYREISRMLFDAGIQVDTFSVDHQSLEAYFLKLTGGAAHV